MSRLAPRLLEYYYAMPSTSANRGKLFTKTLLKPGRNGLADLGERAREDVTAQVQNGYISSGIGGRHPR